MTFYRGPSDVKCKHLKYRHENWAANCVFTIILLFPSLSSTTRCPSPRQWSRWISRSTSSLTLPLLSQVLWGIWLSFPQMILRSSTHPGSVAQWHRPSQRRGKGWNAGEAGVQLNSIAAYNFCESFPHEKRHPWTFWQFSYLEGKLFMWCVVTVCYCPL